MAERQFEQIAGEEVMSARQIADYLNKSRAYIYKILKQDESFPDGFSLTPTGKRFWKKREVETWIKQKMNGTSH